MTAARDSATGTLRNDGGEAALYVRRNSAASGSRGMGGDLVPRSACLESVVLVVEISNESVAAYSSPRRKAAGDRSVPSTSMRWGTIRPARPEEAPTAALRSAAAKDPDDRVREAAAAALGGSR
jgi:hypothetical protein